MINLAIVLLVVGTLTFHQVEAKVYDTVIIGAGISGLAAAKNLQERNLSFIVLEARNRIGGRVWTDRSLGAPCDLGASWIHRSGPTNPITIIANHLNITRVKTNEVSTTRWGEHGNLLTRKQLGGLDKEVTGFLKKVEKRRDDLTNDVSLAEVMKQVNMNFYRNPEANFNFAWDLETDYGAPIEELSAMNYDADSEFPGSTEEVFPTGYDTLSNGIAAPFKHKIFKNKVVNEVDYTDPNDISVTCTDGTVYSTKSVIVTVPLGVLKARSIKFVPELPRKHLQAIQKVGMGVAINKLFLKFSHDFWSEHSRATFFSVSSGGTPETRGRFPEFINGKKLFGANVLLGFAIGNYAKNMESQDDEEVVNDAVGVLRKIFPNAHYPVDYVLTRWFTDPYSRGAYSYLAVGSTPNDYKTLSTPVSPVFFAGEHTILKYKSSVHGAYLSGRRAAGQVISFLK
eukprot:TRINITY_DN6679_c0_g1_i10.p1 TRINITY_DN6679_c0_g1~~TRINITY_DN6679_c0_g1_i10.p1  ORF type:complete len:492 (+),score=71.59 TRINITY_DN6679_c0_g1_i10:112-1476(+)